MVTTKPVNQPSAIVIVAFAGRSACSRRLLSAVRALCLTILYLPLRSASLPASVISYAFMSGSWLKGTLSLGICR